MRRYDGSTPVEKVEVDKDGVEMVEKKTFEVTMLPNYLFIHIRRFSKNSFFKEKNPTIVNFPLRNLEMKEVLGIAAKYDLIANVVHSGKADSGNYRVQALHVPSGEWFDI